MSEGCSPPEPFVELLTAAMYAVGNTNWRRHRHPEGDWYEVEAEPMDKLYAVLRDHFHIEDYEPFAGHRQDDGRSQT